MWRKCLPGETIPDGTWDGLIVNGHIFLTGFMGAGKTSVGRALSEKLRMDFLDLDSEVQKAEGRSIRDIFEEDGESFFRLRETEMLESICARSSPTVVSTGGGVILNVRNRETMDASGEVFYLKADIDTLWKRVRGKKHRPLLDAPDAYLKLKELFKERENIYDKAPHVVFTDNMSIFEVAERIINTLE